MKRTSWPKISPRKNPSGDISWMVDPGMVNGKRPRKFFKMKGEAETYAEQLRQARKNEGVSMYNLPERLRLETLDCQKRLSAVNATLSDAVNFYLKHAAPSGGTKKLSEAITELVNAKRGSGKRESYVKTLEWVLRAFERDFDVRLVNEISRTELETWLTGSFLNLTTRRNRIRDLSILFTFAHNRGYCGSNPLEHIERPVITGKRPEIFTLEEAGALLNAAKEHPELGLLPTIAIGLFAGLRISEIKKLQWKHVSFSHGVIDVSEEIAKTRQQRNVDISETLRAWLSLCGEQQGNVVPANFRRKILELRKFAEIAKWPDNGLRHSFGSYHIARFQNPNLTALQMGHSTTEMLFRHYRNYQIHKKDATRYWKMRPKAENVITFHIKKRKVLEAPTNDSEALA